MKVSGLNLPERLQKPRSNGLSIILDNGLPTDYFKDVIESHHHLIDMVKFGWGTVLVTSDIEKKIEVLKTYGIDFFFGGTLFEAYFHQRKVDGFYDLAKYYDCRFIEISNGTVNMDQKQKSKFIQEFSTDFLVLSEVGFKDPVRSEKMSSADWIRSIWQDIDAGAYKVITESREGGNSGICHASGELRVDLMERLIASDIQEDTLIFEAPNTSLQSYFIKKIGANVNLANIDCKDIVSLETLRLGLRSDTLLHFT